MEVSALKFSGGVGLHGRSPLLRLQSDERLVALVRRGSIAAFEVLVGRYEQRLLTFCRHLLGSREDAEDALEEVMASAYRALLADWREVSVRPWLYRIARNRCLHAGHQGRGEDRRQHGQGPLRKRRWREHRQPRTDQPQHHGRRRPTDQLKPPNHDGPPPPPWLPPPPSDQSPWRPPPPYEPSVAPPFLHPSR